MLVFNDYLNLWTNVLNQPAHLLPSYYQYLQREVYFQDYLDLFCCPNDGNPTYERVIVNGQHTVYIGGLQADSDGIYTAVDQAGQVRLIVDYDFPFDRKELCKEREIRYILIGEAAPSSGAYIYKDALGSYITAPLCARNINYRRLNTFQRLIEFANQGFLLLDFFPFNINFRNIQIILTDQIINSLMTKLENDIKNLNCLHNGWDWCLVGPYSRTSVPIINWLDNHNGGLFMGRTTVHQYDLNSSPNFISRDGRIHVHHTNNLWQNNWNINHLSKRAKITVLVGNSGPNCELIRRVFW